MAAEVDIATLGIKVDATSADEAAPKLDTLAKKADTAEQATIGLSSASKQMQAAIMAAIGAINANTQALGTNTDMMNRNKVASNGAAAAVDNMESRVLKLRSTVDPMAGAIDKVNSELAEARMLFESGAISANEYARAQTILNARSADFARRQSAMNTAMGLGARSARLQSFEMLNLSRQFADIGVTAAMGMNPLMILVQQGPQIADVFQTARSRGIGTAQVFKQIGESVLPLAGRLLSVGTVAGIAFGTLGLAARGAGEGLGNVQQELGLTEKQMDRLKEKGTDLGFTMTDVMAGIASAVADAFNLDEIAKAWNKGLDFLGSDALNFVRDVVGIFGGMVGAIKAGFNDIPNSIAAVFEMAIIKYLEFVNTLLVRSTRVINNFREMLGMEGNLKPFQVDIPKMSPGAAGAADALSKGYREGRSSAQAAFDTGMGAHRRARILEDAGDPEKHRDKKPKVSQEQKDYENAIKAAEAYIKTLKEQTEEIGKNELQLKQLATTRAQATIEEAAHKAQLAGVAVDMNKVKNLTKEMAQAQADWEKAWNDEAIRKFKESLDDEMSAVKLEQKLVGANAEERARATKTREISIRILEEERKGHWGMVEALKAEAQALIDAAGDKARWDDLASGAQRTADGMRDMANNVRDATEGFKDLFGTAGEGFANMYNTIFEYMADQEDRQAHLVDLQRQLNQGTIDRATYEAEAGRTQQEIANAQIASYGDMIHAAKTFFKEGSTGWKVMEAAERAYRLFQFAMMIRSMFMDKASTTSSVANSAARATADGVAAVAKAIASLPFPLNIAAGAATLAFLVAIGVKMMGKGGGGGKASADADSQAQQPINVYGGPTDNYGAPTSGYSVLKPGNMTVGGYPNQPAATSGLTIVQGDTHIVVQGSMDTPTMEQLVPILDANRQQSVQDARVAVSQDLAARSYRQSIGGR